MSDETPKWKSPDGHPISKKRVLDACHMLIEQMKIGDYMSFVTNVILKTSCAEECDAIKKINEYLENENKGQLSQVDSFVKSKKAIECNIYIGGFNFLDIESFIKLFRSIKFNCPDEAQLFIQEQDEGLFTSYAKKEPPKK